MTVKEFEEQKTTIACRLCKAVGKLKIYEQKPHVGTKCSACGGWNTWLKQDYIGSYSKERNELTRVTVPPPPPTKPRPAASDLPGREQWGPPPSKEKSPRYLPAQLSHPQTIEERLAAVEHDLSILCQILIGKKSA